MDLNDPRPDDSRVARLLYDCAKGIAFASAVAIAVTLILFLLAWLHVRQTPPTDTKAMERLINEAKANPDDAELVEELRSLDVVARRAQFQWFHFSHRGAWLLVIGIATLFGALKLMGSLRKRLPDPRSASPPEDRIMARWSVLGGMAILITFLFVFMKMGIPTIRDDVSVNPGENGQAPPSKAQRTLASDDALSKQWTAFRGHQGLGSAPSATLPAKWDGVSGKGLIWKTKIPMSGFNSPIVWNGRIFCSGATADARAVYCLNAETGEMAWQAKIVATPTPQDAEISEDTGYAAATMACNGAYVYAVFGGGELVCLDLDGTVVWEKRLGYPKISYGYSSSLRCVGDTIVLQQDYEPHRRVVALNAHSGNVVWQTPRTTLATPDSGDGMQECWSTPILVPSATGTLLVLNGNPEVRAYDPTSGKQVWNWNGMGGEVATSIAFGGGTLLVSQEYAKTAALKVGDATVLWESDQLDAPDVCSPIVSNGLAFLPTAGGSLSCVNLADGTVKWTQQYEEGFYASPVLVGDQILLIDRKGHARAVKATDIYVEISTHKLGEDCVATPAPVGDRLYVRGLKHVYCFKK